MIGAVQEIGKAKGLWAIESHAHVLDGKYHAGGSSDVNRKPTRFTVTGELGEVGGELAERPGFFVRSV